MGTLFHHDGMHPISDNATSRRQVEIFNLSGTHDIYLRIGNLNEENMGGGYEVLLNEEAARNIFDGLKSAMNYIGYKTA